jgi:hypothetical protein
MKFIVLLLFNILTFSVHANAFKCYERASEDMLVQTHLNQDLQLKLCSGAEDLTPVKCFKSILKNEDLKDNLTLLMSLKICAGAKSMKSYQCIKEAMQSDKLRKYEKIKLCQAHPTLWSL